MYLQKAHFAAGVAVALVASIVVGPARAAHAPSGTKVVGAMQVRELLRGGPVDLERVTVRGTLDLRRLGVVRHAFTCRDCRLSGGLDGAGVLFTKTVDLSGSQILGPVRMEGARFRGPVLFGSPPASEPASFGRGVDFSLARFDDLASFEDATFRGDADFTLTRFGGAAIFAGGEFVGPAQFVRASFGATADFRQRGFRRGASFQRAEFGSRADLSQSIFTGEANFASVRFVGDAIFFGAVFEAGGADFAASFERATAAGSFDFGFADFYARTNFSDISTPGALSFKEARFPPGHQVFLGDVSAGNLSMNVRSVVRSVQPSDRMRTLSLVESSAKLRGDLGQANDAQYAMRQLASESSSWPWRAFDIVFYRGIAGYLVRPIRPLIALLLLAAAISLLRSMRSGAERGGVHRRLTGSLQGVSRFGNELLDTLTLVGRRKQETAARRLEILAYRVLVVCALIGLANSNPTLRTMIDALH